MNYISDKIYIDWYGSPYTNALLKDLTYTNPEYYQKMNMGLPVFKIPKVIKTYELRNGIMEIARGEFKKVKAADPNMKFELRTKRVPSDLIYINNDFDLDGFQEGAITACKNNRQGIIHAVTSAGKSLMILKTICELKEKPLIIVHRKVLVEQFVQDIKKYVRKADGSEVVIGYIGGGKSEIGDITIGIDKSLSKRIVDYREVFGVVFLDECHLAPASTMYNLINSFRAERRYGFSGTLERKDEKQFLMFAAFGQVIHTIGKNELLNVGRVVDVEPHVISTGVLFDYPAVVEQHGITRAYQVMNDYLMAHPYRNQLIIDKIKELSGKGKLIVLSRYVKPCYELRQMLLDQAGIEAGIITGKDAKRSIADYNEMKHSNMQVIFATIGCVSTGVSISDLQNIILISPLYTNKLLLQQIRGRLMRTSEGKTQGDLYYLWDENIFDQRKLNKFLHTINS